MTSSGGWADKSDGWTDSAGFPRIFINTDDLPLAA